MIEHQILGNRVRFLTDWQIDLEIEEEEDILRLIASGCYSGKIKRGREWIIWYC